MGEVLDTLVVGAGVSGLAYAQARGRAARVLVLEASDRAGGLVRTTRAKLDGGGAVQFEWGPEALPGDAPELSALLAELALEPQAVPAPAAAPFVARAGALHRLPASPAGLLASRLLSARGKVRALTEPLRDRSRALDGSVADFVRHRLGPEVLARIADPLVSSIYAADAERLSLRAAYPELATLVTEHGSLWSGRRAQQRRAEAATATASTTGPLVTLPGGLGKLADALAKSLSTRLVVNVRVLSVAQEPATFDDPWEAVADLTRHPMVWRVDAESYHGAGPEALSWRARRLVLALPARAASRLLLPVDRTLGETLASVSSESVVSVSHAWRRQDVGHALDGFGALVSSAESSIHLGTLFSSSIRPACCTDGLVLLRTLLGGSRNPKLIEWSEAELWAAIDREVAPLLRLKGEPLWRSFIRQREALPRYDLEHPRRQEHVGHMLAALPGLSLLGNWKGGTGCDQLVAAARALAREHAGADRDASPRHVRLV